MTTDCADFTDAFLFFSSSVPSVKSVVKMTPMNDDREVILSRVRGALAPLAKRAVYPTYADNVAVMRDVVEWRDPWTFGRRFPHFPSENGPATYPDAGETVDVIRRTRKAGQRRGL